jgi:hypothetical protein
MGIKGSAAARASGSGRCSSATMRRRNRRPAGAAKETMLSLSLFIACASASGVLRSQPVTGVCDDPAAQGSGYFDIAAGTKHSF